MSNDPDYEATQRERAAKRKAAKKQRVDLENQVQQSRTVKALTAENGRLRSKLDGIALLLPAVKACSLDADEHCSVHNWHLGRCPVAIIRDLCAPAPSETEGRG